MITPNAKMATLCNSAIECEVRVQIVLRIMAGAPYLEILIMWCVTKTRIYDISYSTADALIKILPLPGFLATLDTCVELSVGFMYSRRPQSSLHGCVGALDGIAIKIRRQRSTACSDPASYYIRKGFSIIIIDFNSTRASVQDLLMTLLHFCVLICGATTHK